MIKILSKIFFVLCGFHGLIHISGFTAYFPLAENPNLPYKTALWMGSLEVGAVGMQIFSILWLLAGLGYLIAALAGLFKRAFWAPLMLAATLLSLAICALDWQAAFRGALIDIAILLVLALVFGLRKLPAKFPAPAVKAGAVGSMPLPAGLPKPVERYYRLIYGDTIPVYTSGIFSGRGTIRLMGVNFPARVRFSHIAGRDYRHYLETTIFGMPVFQVNERYLDGKSWFKLPFGVAEYDPRADSAANLGLWAETAYYPAVFLTDGRVRWEALDDTRALLHVPFGSEYQSFTVRFDAATGLLDSMETTSRYQMESKKMMKWVTANEYVKSSSGKPARVFSTATWENEKLPWLRIELEDSVFNADLTDYIRATGG